MVSTGSATYRGAMEWLVGLVGGLAVLVLAVVMIERLANRPMRAHRPDDAGESAGAGMFGELVDVFQPSRIHVTSERERQRLDIVQRPAEGRLFDVDLDAGVAYLALDGDEEPPRT
jgi:hypothetical protein